MAAPARPRLWAYYDTATTNDAAWMAARVSAMGRTAEGAAFKLAAWCSQSLHQTASQLVKYLAQRRLLYPPGSAAIHAQPETGFTPRTVVFYQLDFDTLEGAMVLE